MGVLLGAGYYSYGANNDTIATVVSSFEYGGELYLKIQTRILHATAVNIVTPRLVRCVTKAVRRTTFVFVV
jgi:hypothetical protein